VIAQGSCIHRSGYDKPQVPDTDENRRSVEGRRALQHELQIVVVFPNIENKELPAKQAR
jgi:hypothetical protein